MEVRRGVSKAAPRTASRLRYAVALAVAVTCGLLTSPSLLAQDEPTSIAEAPCRVPHDTLSAVERLQADVEMMQAAADRSEGDMQRIFLSRLEKKRAEIMLLTHDAARKVITMGEECEDVDGLHELFDRVTADIYTGIDRTVEQFRLTDRHGDALTPTEETERVDARRRIVSRLDDYFEALLTHAELGEQLGFDVAAERARLVESLAQTIEASSVFLELASERAASLAGRLEMTPGDESLQERLEIAQTRVRFSAEHLKRLVGLMGSLGLDTAEYEKQVITATGDLDARLLDVSLIEALMSQGYRSGTEWVEENGSRLLFKGVLVAFVLLFAGLAAKLVGRLVRKTLESQRFDVSQLLARVLVSSARRLVLLLGVLLALGQLGVSIGPFLAGLGVAGFIVGFALQDTLSNFASGLFILFYRPYDVGDAVEAAGVRGKVSGMSLVNTTILTYDNQRIVVPNSRIWGDVITNVTAEALRRVDMVFGISYSDDIPAAEAVLEEILRSHDRVLDEPEPMVRLHELADSSVNFVVRPWVRSEDYWDVYWDVTREIKLRFDREGISIPFPQRDVHLHAETGVDPSR